MEEISFKKNNLELNQKQLNLFKEHEGEVKLVALYYKRKFRSDTFSLDDFISWGSIGLIKAIKEFDPDKEVKFKTFAERKIKWAIKDGLRKADDLSPKHRAFLNKLIETKKQYRITQRKKILRKQ